MFRAARRQQKVFLFSGQGSQYPRMGLELYENVPAYRQWMERLDQVAKPLIGQSVLEELYGGNGRASASLDRLLFSHPAIFMSEYALAMAYREKGITPDLNVGASLGEYASLAVAEAANPEEMLDCLVRQALLIEAGCLPGGMLAVLESPDILTRGGSPLTDCEVSAINYDTHFVLAGSLDTLAVAVDKLAAMGVAVVRLPVRAGFHSTLIDPVKDDFLQSAAGVRLKKPLIPIISCTCGGEIGNELSPMLLWNFIRRPVKLSQAAETPLLHRNCLFVDVGQGGTMSHFMKRNVEQTKNVESWASMTPFKQELSRFHASVQALAVSGQRTEERVDRPMTVYVFPGQGSQKVGMGKELFAKFPDLTAIADQELGYSIEELCLKDPEQKLNFTAYTQPALYVVNALNYLERSQEGRITPDYVAGHSLGEYNALFAAGVFSFQTGLRLVKKRGELMGQASGGGMAAIVGLTGVQITEILNKEGLDEIDIANYNSPLQVVIAGPKESVAAAKPIFEGHKDVRLFSMLNVSGAFHSRYMENARQEFEAYILEQSFSAIQIPVISNVFARPYQQQAIASTLSRQITHAVQWTDSIRYLMGRGEMAFEEVGDSTVLTGLIRRIQKESQPLIVEEAEIQQEERAFSTETVRHAAVTNTRLETAGDGGKGQHGLNLPDLIIKAEILGSEAFRKRYKLKYAYLAGAMYKGVSSKELVVKMGQAGMMGFLGTGGMQLASVEDDIKYIQQELSQGQAYGMNFIHHPNKLEKEEEVVDLLLRYQVRTIEASAFWGITPSLVKYKAKGLTKDTQGKILSENRIIAKISRPEVAEAFMNPAPERMIAKLLEERKITGEEAQLLKQIPMADDICIEADSGGHTDSGVAYALFPAILKLRNDKMKIFDEVRHIGIGAAGGIGTPEAAAAALVLGADFIVTGSINQCTVEAGTSDIVKEMLQHMNVQDTEYAPAGDMFEYGAKVQVLKKGVFFPARANKLYALYSQYESLDEIDPKIRAQIEEKYFKRSFESIYEELKGFYPPEIIEKANSNPKNKMALVFKWYFNYSSKLALAGNPEGKVDYQIHCGPALGAFNQLVKGTRLEDWRNRNVDIIALKLLNETAQFLTDIFQDRFSHIG